MLAHTSFRSATELFAEELTCHFVNKHLWQSSSIRSKFVASNGGLYREFASSVFSKTIKAAANLMHIFLFPVIQSKFNDLVKENGVEFTSLMAYEQNLREIHFSKAVEEICFLKYCVSLAILAGFFYEWGCEDAPEHVMEFMSNFMSNFFPHRENCHLFCFQLNQVSRKYVETNAFIHLSPENDSSFCPIGMRYNDCCPEMSNNCSCFKFQNNTGDFRNIYKNRIRRFKHYSFLHTSLLEMKVDKLETYVAKSKPSSVSFKSFKKPVTGCLLKASNFVSTVASCQSPPWQFKDKVPFCNCVYCEKYLQNAQKMFGFPCKQFLKEKNYYADNSDISVGNVFNNQGLPTPNAEQKYLFGSAYNENIGKDCATIWKDSVEIGKYLTKYELGHQNELPSLSDCWKNLKNSLRKLQNKPSKSTQYFNRDCLTKSDLCQMDSSQNSQRPKKQLCDFNVSLKGIEVSSEKKSESCGSQINFEGTCEPWKKILIDCFSNVRNEGIPDKKDESVNHINVSSNKILSDSSALLISQCPITSKGLDISDFNTGIPNKIEMTKQEIPKAFDFEGDTLKSF